MKTEILIDSLKEEFEFICSEVEGILLYGSYAKSEADFLRQINGVRNFIIHRYNKLDMGIINEALSRTGELKAIAVKIAEY
jgi:uncharacterized protein YutE (UPF0331/DUF86 family)